LHGGEKVHVPVGLGIGKREVVGYGNCGQENYVDNVHYPFPAIRFKVIWHIGLLLKIIWSGVSSLKALCQNPIINFGHIRCAHCAKDQKYE
jgi:hypothetical protein